MTGIKRSLIRAVLSKPHRRRFSVMILNSRSVARTLLLNLADLFPAPAVPRTRDGVLRLGDGKSLGESRFSLFALRDGLQELVGFDQLQVFIAHGVGRAGI